MGPLAAGSSVFSGLDGGAALETALGVAAAALVMLLTADNFGGAGALALWLAGGRDLRAAVTWEAAYAPLHRSIGVGPRPT